MTMKRYILAIMLCNLIGGSLFAQQIIDPTVEVTRNFDGKMMSIHKSMLNTSINDSLSSFDLNFSYSIFDKQYKDLYEFSPLPSAKLHGKVDEKYPVLLVKAGINAPLNPYGELYFQPRMKAGNRVVLSSNYNGFWGNLPLENFNSEYRSEKYDQYKINGSSSSFGLNGSYGYNWGQGELNLKLHFNSGFNTYYGYLFNPQAEDNHLYYGFSDERSYMKENSAHRFNKVGAEFNIASVDAGGKGAKFNYRLEIKYLNTSDKLTGSTAINYGNGDNNKLGENLIQASGELGPTFGKYNKFSIGFNSENVLYNGLQEYKYGLYEIAPQYTFDMGRWHINAGIILSGRYKSKDDTDKYHTPVFAKADIAYELDKENLWIYAKVDGANITNRYSAILEDNRWISQSSDLKATSIPLRVRGGIRGQIHNKLSYNVNACYTIYEGLIQFVGAEPDPNAPIGTIPDNRLYAVYSNHREFSLGASINWKSKDFEAGTSVEYSNYTDGKKSTLANGHKPFGYAPFKWNLHALYNYRSRVFVGITSQFRSKTPVWSRLYTTEECFISPMLNLGIEARYAVNRTITLFVKGENLLDNTLQYYPQYIEKGISFGGGLLVKL